MKNLLVLLALLIVCVGSASGLACYFCPDCSDPFNQRTSSATVVISPTGFCAIKRPSGGPTSRGAASPGTCMNDGCVTSSVGGVTTQNCCCSRDYCNTGNIMSKSTITVLLGALALVAANRYI